MYRQEVLETTRAVPGMSCRRPKDRRAAVSVLHVIADWTSPIGDQVERMLGHASAAASLVKGIAASPRLALTLTNRLTDPLTG